MAYDNTFIPTDYSVAKGVTYDTDERMWILTIDEVSDKFDDDLVYMMKTEKKANAFLRELSTQVYEYMLSKLLNNSRPIILDILEHDTVKIQSLKKALLKQYRYARVSGGNLIEAQSGINPKTGIVIDPDVIDRMTVGAGVKKSLDTEGLVNSRLVFSKPKDSTEHGVDY